MDGIVRIIMATYPRTPRKPRTRRTNNYWEPVYEPNAAQSFPYADWNHVKKHGASHFTLDATDLEHDVTSRFFPKFENISFKNSDFFGYFDKIASVIVFENCDFDSCDFGLSTWRRAKFTGCTFRRTSLTQCTFIECEFRECSWSEIGLSGNETRLEKTLISNPGDFVNAAYLNLDEAVLSKKGKSRNGQLIKFWESKAVVARQIYNDLKFVGDEDAFYIACKTFITCTSRLKLERILRPGKRKDGIRRRVDILKLTAAILEIGFVRLIASINNWGESVARPAILLFLCFCTFSLLYWLSADFTFYHAIAASFEITSVAGYTRGATSNPPHPLRVLEWCNLAAAIIIYTTFFSTIVAKVCRVR